MYDVWSLRWEGISRIKRAQISWFALWSIEENGDRIIDQDLYNSEDDLMSPTLNRPPFGLDMCP